jgi:hypothetical protein
MNCRHEEDQFTPSGFSYTVFIYRCAISSIGFSKATVVAAG